MLSIKVGTNEDKILSFVADFVKFEVKKVENVPIYTQQPTLIIDENDHIAGLSLIIRFGFFMIYLQNF